MNVVCKINSSKKGTYYSVVFYSFVLLSKTDIIRYNGNTSLSKMLGLFLRHVTGLLTANVKTKC